MYALELINEGDICCEVGVWKGETSEKILLKNPTVLHLIDPWASTDRPNRMYHIDQAEMDDIYESVQAKFEDRENVIIHRKPSDQVSFAKDYFDWVYIDGQHRYNEVMFDLKRFYSSVKNGGWITGDDLSWKDHDDKGITQAVKDFCARFNQEYQVIDGNRFAINLRKKPNA